jgi:signal transduction histidine kinase
MSATATGPASAAFERLMTRFAVGLRVGGAVAGSVGALVGLAAPAAPILVGIAVAGLLGWAASYAVLTLRSGWTRWLVAGDIVITAVLCLGYRWLVSASMLPGWSTWLAVVASSAVVVSQVSPWPVLGVTGTVVLPAAYTVGSLLALPAVSRLGALLVAQGVGAGLLMWMLRRRVRAADVAIAQQEALQRDAAVQQGRRAEEREHYRLLHDSASATLTAVAAGGVAGSPTLRAQARRDLDVVERIQAPADAPALPAVVERSGAGADPLLDRDDLRGWLAPVVSAQPALAVETAVADVAVPAVVAAALAGAVAEALRNVVRHAGAGRVSLRAWPAHGVVRVELADAGRGFDPAQVPAHRRGLRESVVARMSRVGGSASITSRPGEGTRIVLEWPAVAAESPGPHTANGSDRPDNGSAGAGNRSDRADNGPGAAGSGSDRADNGPDRPGDGPDRPKNDPGRPDNGSAGAGGPARAARRSRPGDGAADGDAAGHGGFSDLVAARYQRGFELAVVAMFAVRHVANALVMIVTHRWAYRSFGAEILAWAVMAAVGVAGSLRLLWRRTGRATSWLLAAVVLAASAVATAAIADRQELTPAHWALGATGWFGIIVLLRRPIAELAALIAINAGMTLAVLLRDGATDRVSLARFLMMAYSMAALQLGLALVVGALDATARRAAAAAEQQATVRRRAEVAEALHRSRLDRYQTVRRSVVPLLVGLARGELDPADRRTQRRCAIEGSRLRRLFAETDDVPDPLLHELRACADIAYSRGVLVDMQVVGELPELSLPVRRALTEAPLHVLAGAQRQARVTVLGRSDEVAVSVLADASLGEPAELHTPLDRAPTVTVQESVVAQEGEDRRWIQARWRG